MQCVPARNDVLTDKMYYPGTYYPSCTVFRSNKIGESTDLMKINCNLHRMQFLRKDILIFIRVRGYLAHPFWALMLP